MCDSTPERQSFIRGAARLSGLSLRGLLLTICIAGDADAETIGDALLKAYRDNPEVGEQRANVRARDEDIPKAKAEMRPRASISLNGGPQFMRVRQPAGKDTNGNPRFVDDHNFGEPRGGSFAVSQVLFDGFRMRNTVRQAEAGIFAARETMRLTEQQTLLNAATAYMNVLRDTAVASLRRSNIAVLKEQLRVAQDRYSVGEVTVTDVAQAQSALAQAHSDLFAATGALETSVASYEQVVGERPKRLEPAPSLDALLANSRDEAIGVALAGHASVRAAQHQADAAEAAVKVAAGALLPSASVTAQINQQYDSYYGYQGTKQFGAQLNGQLNIPLYQGGAEYSAIRQAKEQLGQALLHVATQRNAIRAGVVQAFAQFTTAKASIASSQAAVKSAERALKGVRDEAFFGQRTTLDVLNAQQALLTARVNLVTAQRDRVVASYAVLAATGQLSLAALGLGPGYDPKPHFNEVRRKWIGVSTQ